jgi:hypothetical protein
MSTIQTTFAGICCIDHRNHRNSMLNHHRVGAKAKKMKKRRKVCSRRDDDDDDDDDGKRPQPIFRGIRGDEVSANTGNERAFDLNVRELLQRTVGYREANINLQPRVRREELEASVLVALLRKRGVHGRTGVDQSRWAGQHAAILEEPV